jgi:sec-independent protein translocase protein TatA
MLGASEILVIALIIFFIFGAKRLPEIGKNLGKTVKEIKNINKDVKGKEEEDEPPELDKAEKTKEGSRPKATSLRGEINSIPGVQEIKAVKETASQVRKWLSFIKS